MTTTTPMPSDDYTRMHSALLAHTQSQTKNEPLHQFVAVVARAWMDAPIRQNRAAKREIVRAIGTAGREAGILQPFRAYDLALHIAMHQFAAYFQLPAWLTEFCPAPSQRHAQSSTNAELAPAEIDVWNRLRAAAARISATDLSPKSSPAQIRVRILTTLLAEPLHIPNFAKFAQNFSLNSLTFSGNDEILLHLPIGAPENPEGRIPVRLSATGSRAFRRLHQAGLLQKLAPSDLSINDLTRDLLSFLAAPPKWTMTKIEDVRYEMLNHELPPALTTAMDPINGHVPWSTETRQNFLYGSVLNSETEKSRDARPTKVDKLRDEYATLLAEHPTEAQFVIAVTDTVRHYGGERTASERSKHALEAHERLRELLADYASNSIFGLWIALSAAYLTSRLQEGRIVGPTAVWQRLTGIVAVAFQRVTPENLTTDHLRGLATVLADHYASDQTPMLRGFMEYLHFTGACPQPLKIIAPARCKTRQRRTVSMVLGPAELQKVWNAAIARNDDDMLWRILLASAAFRVGEIATARTSDFLLGSESTRPQDWFVWVNGSKSTDARRLVRLGLVLAPAQLDWLAQQKELLLADSPQYLVNPTDSQRKNLNGAAWKAVKERLVGRPLKKFAQKITGRPFTAHDFRRTALCSLALRLGELGTGIRIQKIADASLHPFVAAPDAEVMRTIVPGISDAQIKDYLRRKPNTDTLQTHRWRAKCITQMLVHSAATAGHCSADTFARDYFPAWGDAYYMFTRSRERYHPNLAEWDAAERQRPDRRRRL